MISFLAIDCGPLTSPTNGIVRVPGTQFGNSARYSCSFGFILEGEAFRACTIDGTWSGEAPVCRGELIMKSRNYYFNTMIV